MNEKQGNHDIVEIRAFLDAGTKRFAQTLISEREAADRMVQHYLTLSSALLGGYFYFHINQKLSDLPESITVLLLFVWLLSGISVLVRLLKRNLIGRLYQVRIREARRLMATGSERLTSIVDLLHAQEDDVNQPNSYKGKIDRYLGGFGPAVILFNCIIFVLIFDQLHWNYVFCLKVSTLMGVSLGILCQGALWALISKRKIRELRQLEVENLKSINDNS